MCKIDFVVFESSDKKDGKYLKDFLGIKVCEMSSHSPVGKVMRENVRVSHVLAGMCGVTLSPPHRGWWAHPLWTLKSPPATNEKICGVMLKG